MQEQRGTIGSFPGSLDLNHASTSITAVDQQLCWNNMQNAAEDHLADCIVAPDDIGITYINPVGQERQNPRRWCLGEPSSSGVHNQTNLDEQRRDYRCSASVGPCTSNGPSLGELFSESTATVPFNGVNRHPVMTRRSNLDAATPSINLNEEYIIPVANNHAHNACKSTGTGNEQMQPGGSSVPYPSGSGGYLVEETDNSISASAEGRRASCKRKLPEGVVGQASGSGSCSYVQSAETSAWSSAPANYNAPSEQLNTGINVCPRGLSFDSPQDLAITGNIDSSYRNVRMRVHPSSQPDSVPQPLFPTGSVVRPYSYPSSQQLPRPFPVNNSLDSRSASVAGRTISQNQPVVFQVPAVPRNLQPFSASGASASRPGNSSNSAVSGNIDAPQERTSSRNVGRGIREHLRFTPSNELMRNIAPNPTNRSVVSGNIRGPGHVMSAQAASSSVIPSAAPSGAYHAGTPSRSSRRLTEYVRRSLFPSAGSDSGGQSSNSSLHSGPSSQEMLLPSATSNQDHLQSSSRLGSWMERQGDRVLSIPLRTLPTFREGRRGRLVSEQLRTVLDLMRRGEALRFEDVMILDPSALFGVADIHDRHRDMRLDVDNMSYEELLALEERIGNVCTGLSEETILSKLKQYKYSNASGGQEEAEPCCVCQEEYNNGEDIGKLDCGHEFHRDCIKQWLGRKNSCPICKTTGLAT